MPSRKHRNRNRVHLTSGETDYPAVFPASVLSGVDKQRRYFCYRWLNAEGEIAEYERIRSVLIDRVEVLRDELAILIYEVLYHPVRAFARAWKIRDLINEYSTGSPT